jgi:choline dehydrogenase-like flavoprotein
LTFVLAKTLEWIVENYKSHRNIARQSVPKPEYDFIVVGAGSAGSVVASRLSENPNVSVLLVEYGGPENCVTDTPAFFALSAKSEKDYAFASEPQTNAFLNMNEQRAQLIRGRSLGGSSAING